MKGECAPAAGVGCHWPAGRCRATESQVRLLQDRINVQVKGYDIGRGQRLAAR